MSNTPSYFLRGYCKVGQLFQPKSSHHSDWGSRQVWEVVSIHEGGKDGLFTLRLYGDHEEIYDPNEPTAKEFDKCVRAYTLYAAYKVVNRKEYTERIAKVNEVREQAVEGNKKQKRNELIEELEKQAYSIRLLSLAYEETVNKLKGLEA